MYHVGKKEYLSILIRDLQNKCRVQNRVGLYIDRCFIAVEGGTNLDFLVRIKTKNKICEEIVVLFANKFVDIINKSLNSKINQAIKLYICYEHKSLIKSVFCFAVILNLGKN